MVVSWAIDVQPTRGGQVDTTHYGPAGHAVDAGKPLVFQIGVQMTWQPPERNVRCGPLTGLKYPEKGPMAGVPVACDAFFSGFDKLMEHGVIVRQDTETGPDGIAMLVVRPNDEAVDAIRTGKVVTERGDLEPQVRVLGSLGSTIGVANDPLFAPSLQWSVTFHVPLRDYDFCLDRNEMPIPCPTAPPPGSS